MSCAAPPVGSSLETRLGDRILVAAADNLMTKIRPSIDSDLAAICDVHRRAFGQEEGQEIVDLVCGLLADETAQPILSLVAETEQGVVGHVLFTRVTVEGADVQVQAGILAPLAVLPENQNSGVGGALTREGLRQLSSSGVGLVFVLGHPEYYPRFGFEPASGLGLMPPYPVPAEHQEAWMVQELRTGLLGRVQGRVSCARTLDSPEYWLE